MRRNFIDGGLTLNRKGILIWASGVHFLVDLICIWMLTHQVSGSTDWYLKLLAYNFLAFAVQMPLGIIADWLASRRETRSTENIYLGTAVSGCVLMLVLLMCRTASWLTVLTAGTGNALFHVGSGAKVLELYREKTSAPGIFVSTGALGLFAGGFLPFTVYIRGMLILVMAAALGTGVWLLRGMNESRNSQERGANIRKLSAKTENVSCGEAGTLARGPILSIFFLFLVIVLRSLEGMLFQFPWNQGIRAFLLVCMVAGGKCAGGFAADRFGSFRTAVISLGLAAVLLLCSDLWPAGLLGVLAFNMTMPVTLVQLSRRLKAAPGFAFGLTTFALYLGILPVYMDKTKGLSSPAVYAGMAAASLILIAAALRKETVT